MSTTHAPADLERRRLLASMTAMPFLTSPAGAKTMPDPSARAGATSARATIVFDVNETLLDFNVLAPVFVKIFGDATMLRTWFNQVVLYSEALTLAGDYADSGVVGGAVVEMLAATKGRRVTAADLSMLKHSSAAMPTYADTPTALAALKKAGFRLVTLSNNPSAAVDTQLTNAGLRTFFDELHSIDDGVRRYKPSLESYKVLATTLGIAPSDLWLVSCHAFDTLGAAAAGYRTALVLRAENAPIALGRPPEIVADDLLTLVDRIIHAAGQTHHG